jgi:hypothetical protein
MIGLIHEGFIVWVSQEVSPGSMETKESLLESGPDGRGSGLRSGGVGGGDITTDTEDTTSPLSNPGHNTPARHNQQT